MKINPIYTIMIIALLGFSIYFNVKQFADKTDADKRIELLQNTSSKQSVVIERYIAPDNTKHAVTPEIYAKTDVEKELAISPGYVDSLRKALDIKTSQITELTRVKATTSGAGKIDAVTDSLGKKTYVFNNGFLNFSHNDSLAKYRYKIAFTDVKYYTGNWLKGKKYFHDLHFADPNAAIDGLDRFTIPDRPPKRIGLGLQAGYYYDPARGTFMPAVGIGLSYNLIRF